MKLLVLAAALAVSPACKKKENPAANTGSGSAAGSAMTGSADGSAAGSAAGSADGSAAGSAAAGSADGSAAGSAAAATPTEDTADWIKVHAMHHDPKPEDPIELKFEKFKVAKASFDPAKIEGGTATIELDVTSLKSNSDKRDQHLASPDYIDSAKWSTATVDIGNVKKKDDKNFTADAKVKFRGVEKTYPVAFEVVEAKEDWIRVKGEHKFQRMDFKVGRPAGPDPKNPTDPTKAEGVGAELTVKVQLTLKKA